MGFRIRGRHLPGGKAHRFFERAAILTVLRGGFPFARNEHACTRAAHVGRVRFHRATAVPIIAG